ncbi:TPA: hypothetical protein N0F65_007264 [Lagenidium giganteum]|uniref:Rho guanine nucleotide exchange factor n=1 Tax=Lagenidium giganteum TaxID=4803 RepID=A0AAV2YVQ0_9STRA|nr:TPA: hypothetical protein N0F65_007264 [Lagenidium giganteum]
MRATTATSDVCTKNPHVLDLALDLDLRSFKSPSDFTLLENKLLQSQHRHEDGNVHDDAEELCEGEAELDQQEPARDPEMDLLMDNEELERQWAELFQPSRLGPYQPLRPGIILFDPNDLHKSSESTSSVKRNRSFKLQLDDPEREKEHGDMESESPASPSQDSGDGDNQVEEKALTPNSQAAARETTRQRIIDEICSTEKTYVHDIRTLHDYYLVPLEENRHQILEDAQIAVFFNNLRQLVMLNSKLLNDLMEIVERRTQSSSKNADKGNQNQLNSPVQHSEGIGAVFCRYAPLFKLYAGYAKDYEEVARLLQTYGKDSSLGFTAFLETCKTRSGSSQSFQSLLIMPIQRVPRYKLLLERANEYTKDNHHDKMFLNEAVSRIRLAASLINETIRHQEHLEMLLQTQKKFVGQFSLFTPGRRLLKAGKLIKMSTKRQEEVMLHLFNDILLYSGVLITGGYRIRRVVYLSSKAVGVKSCVPASYHSLFESRALREDCGFVVTSMEKTFVLFAATPADRTQWIKQIDTAIRDAQKNSNNNNEEGPADAAALWVPDAVVESCTLCRSPFRLYFRRHHCRRCGAVVCGNCSGKRSILFVADSAREERVCNVCFKILDLVKKIAYIWLSRLVEFKGVLRRKRYNKWTDHYYELKAGVLRQYTISSAAVGAMKQCTDSLDLVGAIVIHRSDSRAQKNRHCFQISPSEFAEGNSESHSHITPEPASALSKKSPFKSAVTLFGEVVRNRESFSALSSEGSMSSMHKSAHVEPEWILCAEVYDEEIAWSHAIQRSADKALNRLRRSRVTEYVMPVPLDKISSLPQSDGRLSDALESLFDETAKIERHRLHIVREILRSEESYVTCLGECIRLFVQPLMLRQLEGQKLFRRKQSKYKKSLLNSFSSLSSSSSSLASAAASAFAHRTHSNGSIQNVKTVRTFGGASMQPTTPTNKSKIGPSHLQKILLLDADMAIFFSSIDQLCTLNQQLLEHLSRHFEEIKSQAEDTERVFRAGAIFNAYAPLFQLYTSYASRHEAALDVIETPQFTAFLKEMPEEASLHRLRTYLNMPMERIPRYKVFLNELLECTPSDHIDHPPLQSAIKNVDMVAAKIQEIITRRENAKKIQELSTKVGLDLKGKRFVKEGILRKVCRSKVQKYYFVLLEDALVYGRTGNSLQKKKFRSIELWECQLSDNTDSMPQIINTVAGTSAAQHAFYFFSPLKSFILLADSEEEKGSWTTSIESCIHKTLSGATSQRRASLRSEILLDEEDFSNDCDIESAFVIKNGWLNVMTQENKKTRRLWISLTMQSISFSTMFKAVQPDETISIGLCEAVPLKDDTYFRVTAPFNEKSTEKKTYIFETQSLAEREEWLRALTHCITGNTSTTIVEMRRRSLNNATLAPIFMFNKVSNVCTICFHSFAVYRPRHHCRLCGSLVCGNCSKRKWTLSYSSSKKASRICDSCAEAASSTSGSLVAEV